MVWRRTQNRIKEALGAFYRLSRKLARRIWASCSAWRMRGALKESVFG